MLVPCAWDPRNSPPGGKRLSNGYRERLDRRSSLKCSTVAMVVMGNDVCACVCSHVCACTCVCVFEIVCVCAQCHSIFFLFRFSFMSEYLF